MLNDSIKAVGTLRVVLTGPDGVVKEDFEVKNLVVSVGKNFIAARMKDTGIPAQMSHMEIGSGSTTPVNGNTTIQSPFSPQARVALAVAGGSVSSNAVTYAATFGAGVGTGAVAEAAIFNGATVGTMLCRTTFPVVNKPAEDSLSISWSVSIQ